jgi:hypothetical protein
VNLYRTPPSHSRSRQVQLSEFTNRIHYSSLWNGGSRQGCVALPYVYWVLDIHEESLFELYKNELKLLCSSKDWTEKTLLVKNLICKWHMSQTNLFTSNGEVQLINPFSFNFLHHLLAHFPLSPSISPTSFPNLMCVILRHHFSIFFSSHLI